MKKIILFFILCYGNFAFASETNTTWNLDPSQKSKLTYTGLFAGPALISIYGAFTWNWGRRGFGFRDEKFFQKNTYAGGVDKVGHAYTHHLMTTAYFAYFSKLGWSKKEATTLSILAATSIGLFIEIGDGVSRFGFSYGDIIADLAGIAFASLQNAYPTFYELFGFQMQYWRLHLPFEDSNHQKFIINLHASGIPYIKEIPIIRYINFDVGYYTRNYGDDPANPQRNPAKYTRHLYVGLSLNIWKLFNEDSYTGKIFKYYQTPFNALELKGKNF